jgi:D-sedoheptulose 7-phosphate isomerase
MEIRLATQTARQHFITSAVIHQRLAEPGILEEVVEISAVMARAINSGHKILLCGNGGSAADAQHIAAEFTCRLRVFPARPGIPAIALTTDTSFLTACANDFGFESVFERLLDTLGDSGDVLIAISTSGNSSNVIRAVSKAREKGLFTVGLTGGTGGDLVRIVDRAIVVPSESTAHIQEAHASIGHVLCELVENALYPVKELQ